MTPARVLLAGVTAATLLAAPTVALAAPPHTVTVDTVGSARARATQLRHQVDALQLRAEQASEAYDAAEAQLGLAVNADLTAQQQLDEAHTTVADQGIVADQHIRALYMSGGMTGTYASLLSSTSIEQLTTNLHNVDAIITGQTTATDNAHAALAAQTVAQRHLADVARRSTQLQKVVAHQSDAVTALLDQSTQLLAQADSQVRTLVAQQQQAAAAAAAASARAQLGSLGLINVPNVPASPRAAAAIAFARLQLGKPYVWGATGPSSYDCSGLTGAAYAAAGLGLPRTSRQQWYSGPHIALPDLQPGDLLFWATNTADPGSIHHVAMYVGNGLMIAAPHTGDVVKVQQVYLDGFIGAVRPDPSSVVPDSVTDVLEGPEGSG